jgi:hypothetical protein
VRPPELVYRTEEVAQGYSLWGGLHQVWPPDQQMYDYGFAPERAKRRRALLATVQEPRTYLDLHLRWFVLGPEDAALGQAFEGWVRDGRARLVDRYGELRLFELVPGG